LTFDVAHTLLINMTYRSLAAVFAIWLLSSGCAQMKWEYVAVPDVRVTQHEDPGTMGPLVLTVANDAQSSKQKKETGKEVKPRTVLMATTDASMGDYSSQVHRTFLLFLDGAPKPGKIWFDTDNSVLITYSAWSAPDRTRVGLTGSVNIVSVNGNEVVADVALRDTSEVDQYQWVDRSWDPGIWQWPTVLTGRHVFRITAPEDPIFEKAAVKWVKAQ
jgi:hypothetical protein